VHAVNSTIRLGAWKRVFGRQTHASLTVGEFNERIRKQWQVLFWVCFSRDVAESEQTYL